MCIEYTDARYSISAVPIGKQTNTVEIREAWETIQEGFGILKRPKINEIGGGI